MTNSKLDTGLEPSITKKSEELKFTDYSINKFKPNYELKKKRTYPLTDSGIKGLKLNCVKKTNNKFFIQNYWFNGQSDLWTVGEFRKDIFGVKECQTKVIEIMKTHTDDNGLWIKSPKITSKQQKERVKKAELEDRKRKTIAECIELLCKAGFPKIKREGTICGQGIMGICLHLIGKNKRTKLLDHDDDEFGNGFVTFRSCKVYNTNKPKDWDDLFNKFPSGHGVIKIVNGRKVNGLSMYDHPVFSKYLIEELTPGLINDYLDEYTRGYGTKRKMIYALQVLWQHSKKYMGVTKPLNPTSKEALEIKLPGISKAKNSQYNRRKNGPDELQHQL